MRRERPWLFARAGAAGGLVAGLADLALAAASGGASGAALVGVGTAAASLFAVAGGLFGALVDLALRGLGASAAPWLRDEGRPGAVSAALLALGVALACALGLGAPVGASAFAHGSPSLAALAVAASLALGAFLARRVFRSARRRSLPRASHVLPATLALGWAAGFFVFRDGGFLEALEARPFVALGAGATATVLLALLFVRPRRDAAALLGAPARPKGRLWRFAGGGLTLGVAAFALVYLGADPEVRAASEGALVGRALDRARAVLHLGEIEGSALDRAAAEGLAAGPRPGADGDVARKPRGSQVVRGLDSSTSSQSPQPSKFSQSSQIAQATQAAHPVQTPHSAGAPGAPSFAPARRVAHRAFPAGRPPHIVLITVDALRADHLGLYGYERATSPELDAFAKGATVFERAYSQETKTKGSIPSILTGRWPSDIRWGGHRYVPLHPSEKTLAEKLLAAGYHTAGFVTHSYFLPSQGMGRGFAHYDTSLVSTDPAIAFGRPSGAALTEKVIDYLGRAPAGRPFFLWAHYFDPHERYLVHPGFSRFGGAAKDRYDGEIAYTDHHVGRLLRALRSHPEAERIVVILTADHGEAFGEHGARYHGHTLYDEEIRVPLVVSMPGARPERADTPVALIDLAPTIFELAGLRPAPEHRGRSLVPVFFGESLAAVPIFSEILPEDRIGRKSAIVDGSYKLVFDERSNLLRLFDLRRDPRERVNRLRDEPEVARALATKLRSWRAREVPASPTPFGAATRLGRLRVR